MTINFDTNLTAKKAENVSFGKKKNEKPETVKLDAKYEQSLMSRARNNAAAAYFQALLAMGGAGVASTSMTSCVKQETTVNIDTKTFEEYLKKLIEEQQKNNNQNAQMMQILMDLLSEVRNGNLNIDQALNKLIALVTQLNSNDKELIALINQINADNNIKAEERLQKIIDAINEVGKQLSDIKELVKFLSENVTNGDKEIATIIQKWMEQYNNNEIERSEMIDNIYKQLLESNKLSGDILSKIDQIIANGEKNHLEDSEILNEILNVLKSIDSTLKQLSENFSKFAEQTLDKQDKSFNMLSNIYGGIQEVNSQLKEIKTNQTSATETLVKVAENGDKILAQLALMDQKMFTKDEIKNYLGSAYNELKAYLDKIGGNQLTYEQMNEIMNKYKTDLTKTNALIETLTTVVQNMNNGGQQLTEILNVLNSMKDNSTEGLTKILEKLANIEGGLDALVKTANVVQQNQEKSMESAEVYAKELKDEIAKISSNMINKEDMAAYATKLEEYLVKAEQSRQQSLVLIQTVIDKMDKGNGVNIDELIAKLPNYTDILNEISSKIGKLVTKEDFVNLIVKTQPDLTKTNALIETLTTVVQNMNVGGSGSTDTAELERIAGLILDAVVSGQNIDANKTKEILEALKKISDNTTPKPETPETKSSKTAYYTDYVR